MEYEMRRAERQLPVGAAHALLARGEICQLAMVDRGEPYLVTLNYGFKERTLYFHAARQGRKMDILSDGSRVCFTVVQRHELVTAEKACNYSMKYESVVGWGSVRFLQHPDEKRDALGVIMAQYAPGEFSFPDGPVAGTALFAVDIEQMTAKSNF